MKVYYVRHTITKETFEDISRQAPDYIFDGRAFNIHNEHMKMKSRLYYELPGIGIAVNEAWSDEDVLLKDVDSKEPIILIRFIIDENLYQESSGKSLGKSSPLGAQMYHTHNTLDVRIPANKWVRWIGIRVTANTWDQFTHGRWEELDKLMHNKEKWVIYEALTFQMEEYIRKIFKAQEEDEGMIGETLGNTILLLSDFFLQILKRKKENRKLGVLTADMEVLFEMKEYLLNQLTEPPTIAVLTKKFGMSRTRLLNNFKNVFGLPPHQFVLRAKYKEAYRLVRQTDQSLTSIAHNLGFSNIGHFTNGFKKEFGLTPSKLRNAK
ncbi:helix-turn-helix transcriptional regulator [Sediminitomix flava]|uniref:AraC-like DNA-binding protein n=1 Tax=Sediminitomix flava TaxID=379075 RepID=A0A315ZFC6_SEDFL|nr:AraC family transcriptional regulator [Sediminitomix flava]PWJ43860.1 AraC-like DNA-binding protein [Sediminitomix flava]